LIGVANVADFTALLVTAHEDAFDVRGTGTMSDCAMLQVYAKTVVMIMAIY